MRTPRKLFSFVIDFVVAAALNAVASLVGSIPAEAATIKHFSVLIRGEPAGKLIQELSDDGYFRVDYHFDDNGRGPSLSESWTVDNKARPTDFRASGRSTLGAAVEERFSFSSDGRIRWQSRIDSGDTAAPGRAHFIPLDPSPAFIGELATALMRAPANKVPLVGGASAQLEVLHTLTANVMGSTIELQLVTITGVDSDPLFLWLRNTPSPGLFAIVDSRLQVVERGSESLVKELLAVQTRHETDRLVRLRDRLSTSIAGTTLIRNVNWFDSASGRIEGPSDIWLFDGVISTITPPGIARIRPDHLVDGSGQTLLPGLIDTHVHYSADQGLHRLAAGITSVRDMGGSNTVLAALRSRIERNEISGPRLELAGFLEGRSRFSSRNGFVVDSLSEARQAIDWYARNGYRTLKLYSSIRPEWVASIIRQAKNRGMRVSGHVPAFMRAEEAVLAGFDELTHINQILLNFVGRPEDDTRTMLRFSRVGEEGHSVGTASRSARAFIDLLRQRGTVVDPTLVAFEAMFTQQQGQPNPTYAAISDHLPLQWQRELRAAELDLDGPKLIAYRTSFERMLEMTKALHEGGVTLITGTDSPNGLALHRELELYVQAGIPASAALQAATLEAARALGQGDRLGKIERGRPADLILVAGNPVATISDIRRISLVIQGIHAWQPSRLWRALGFKPFAEAAPIDGVVGDD